MPQSQPLPAQRPAAPVAVVLVAGIGQRLHPLTAQCPKALVPVAGETMLARTVRLLASHGVRRVVLATGFEQHSVKVAMNELLEEASSSLPRAPLNLAVQYCFNPDYRTTQNSMSLAVCRNAVDGQDFYKIDGDLLFTEQVLQRLDACPAGLSVAVDTRATLGQEEMKVQLAARATDDGDAPQRIAAFGKGLDPVNCAGESIGLERVSGSAVRLLFEALDQAVEKKRTTLYYEDIYSELLQSQKGFEAVAVDVSDLPWIEIDTHEDLKAAEAMVQAGKL